MTDKTQGPYGNLTDIQVVQAGKNALAATDVEMMRRLKNSIEILDQNLSSLLSTIEKGQKATDRLNRGIFWLTVFIALLTAVQVIYLFAKP
jgi:hypothetical protein